MNALAPFATLVVATIFAVAGAAGLHLLLLRGAFWMMRPATAGRIPARNRTSRKKEPAKTTGKNALNGRE